MPESKVFRYEVPVDDAWHRIKLTGSILHVAARQLDVVEFWAVSHDGGFITEWDEFRAVGTGQPLGDNHGVPVGSAIAPGSFLVWHLFKRIGKGTGHV